MFTKKIFTALLLAPLFTGCVVSDGDDDDGAETGDTDPTAATMTDPSATMTDPSATMTDPTAESSGTDPSVGTESGSESGSETADTGDTTGGGGGMFCAPACEVPEDCCAEGVPCGDPPYSNFECNEGLCELIGCIEDGDCTIIAGTTCHQVNEFGQCVPLCTVETEAKDCLTDQGETCTGMTDDGDLYCIVEPDPVPPCEDDKACFGFGVCNLDSGVCECADETQCPDGYACIGA